VSELDPQRPSEPDKPSIDAPTNGLDAVATARRHPEWFFRDRTFDTEEAVALLVSEALRGGANSVTVRREGEWASVEADEDWLRGDVAAFFTPESYVEGGRNSSRVEVALPAFCRAVVTATAEGLYEVASTPSARGQTGELRTWRVSRGRLVAFLPPVAPHDVVQVTAPPGTLQQTRLRLVQGEGEEAVLSAVRSFVVKQRDANG
jgi:hypothetical protein